MAAGDGLIIMKPTSIAYAGTTAGINADGGVDFTAVTSLSLNGVFVSGIDNYVIYFYGDQLATGGGPLFKLRVSGVDTTGTDYTLQRISADGATASGSRVTSSTFTLMATAAAVLKSGSTYHLYGPSLAQPTAMRLTSADALSNARIFDEAATHSLSTAYDGFSITPSSAGSSLTGNIVVFGYEE